jgi:hypothetical protein
MASGTGTPAAAIRTASAWSAAPPTACWAAPATTSAFGGAGAASAGQLRVTLTSPGQWRAQGDTDGNGIADLQIDIVSATGPGAGGWFIL